MPDHPMDPEFDEYYEKLGNLNEGAVTAPPKHRHAELLELARSGARQYPPNSLVSRILTELADALEAEPQAPPQPKRPTVFHYLIEEGHLAGLRLAAERLYGAQEASLKSMRDAAHIIMTAVRYAETIEAFRRTGSQPYIHTLPRKEDKDR